MYSKKEKKIKNDGTVLLLTVPNFSTNFSIPYPAVPLLAGQLKNAGYKCVCRDLFNELYEDGKYPDFVSFLYNKYTNLVNSLSKKRKLSNKIVYTNNLIKKKYKKILEYIKTKNFSSDFNEELQDFIFFLCRLIHFKYNLDYEKIKEQCDDRNLNFLIEYFEKKIETFSQSPCLIGLSSYPGNEIYPIFTLAKILKKKFKNSKIVLGGYQYIYLKEEIKNNPDIFDEFCDFIIIGDGENAIVELMNYISGYTKISKVSNLAYKNSQNKVHINNEVTKVNINKLSPANYDDYNFETYNKSKRTIAMTLSKGCYWGKCKFCSYMMRNKCEIKGIDKAIEEIKFYINNYKINHINFTDDAISPQYYYHLSNAIIKNNLNISFSSYAIFDSDFTYKILHKLKKAGLKAITWGFETASKHVFDRMEKSGSFENRAQILKTSNKAGIINSVSFIEGLPNEKTQDLIETVKFIYENINYIDIIGFQKFQVRVGSDIAKHPKKYNIEIFKKDDFSLEYNYVNKDTDINKENSFVDFLNNLKSKKIIKNTTDRECIFIATYEYLKKYAPHYIENSTKDHDYI